MNDGSTAGRAAILAVFALVAAIVGWLLFVRVPDDLAELLGVLLVIGTVVVGLRYGGSVATRRFPDYEVAEVAVEGPITRDGASGIVGGAMGASADAVVEQIEQADADENAAGLLVKLNTPGGEIVPSEDIRLAAERFDGPTVAYTTDVCASGGYDIASGCDELWARSGSIVGSIGVIGSRVNATELADKLGLSYEQFTAGEYKDAGLPLKELDEDERAYLQGIVDDYYDDFVSTVAEGRDLDEEDVRSTEARVFLGDRALELGLVDEVGTRLDVEDRLADLLDVEEVRVREFEPERGIAERLRGGAETTAYALGAGIASVLGGTDEGLVFRR
ncbi:signal peptide peptidase SppA [Haloarculaceae archaeon H-GB2-1]|nr:signal peptide peptidase SppA [Haloarculaceae archaeon H-GB1-1]MEA5407987.1 signal peptide peptidase SppA [Haloarculaceae archaeon H-GB2-1]